jgi:hypothetical protein
LHELDLVLGSFRWELLEERRRTERFMISTHPWVLEKFAVKARDYDEYIRQAQAERPPELVAATAAA